MEKLAALVQTGKYDQQTITHSSRALTQSRPSLLMKDKPASHQTRCGDCGKSARLGLDCCNSPICQNPGSFDGRGFFRPVLE